MRTVELRRPGAVVHVRLRPGTTGQWVLFLHGAGMDGRMFNAHVAAVPQRYGVCVWDARAHGRSELVGPFHYRDMLDDLIALIDWLDAADVTLVGQSMGGNLAQSYAAEHPERVQGLVLIDCTDNHGPLTRLDQVALELTQPILTAYLWRLTVAQSARACGTHPSTVAYARERLTAIGKKRFVEVMGFWRQALKPAAQYRLPARTLLLRGAQDRTGNVKQAMQRLAERDPKTRLTVLDDAAHNSNMDQPERTNDLLRAFLARPADLS